MTCAPRQGRAKKTQVYLEDLCGDRSNPDCRSRLVAKEIKRDARTDLFAATPPLEATKMLFSLAVTEGYGFAKDKSKGMKLDL